MPRMRQTDAVTNPPGSGPRHSTQGQPQPQPQPLPQPQQPQPQPQPPPHPQPQPQPYEPFIPTSALPGGALSNLPPGYTVGPRPVVWHSPLVLLGTLVASTLSIVLLVVAMVSFPQTDSAEAAVVGAVVLVVNLLAMAITTGVMLLVERARRRIPARIAAPISTRVSVIAILAVVFSVAITVAFLSFGGISELSRMSGGLRAQYLNLVLSHVIVGVPWVLGVVFGAWGYRPGGHRVTNVLALIALGLGVLMMVPIVVATFGVASGAAI